MFLCCYGITNQGVNQLFFARGVTGKMGIDGCYWENLMV